MDVISTGLQKHLVPSMNTLPAAARALVNVSSFCHSRCSNEDQRKRCSLCFFLTDFLDGQSLSVLGIGGGCCLLSIINVTRFVCLVEKAVACGVRCFPFYFPSVAQDQNSWVVVSRPILLLLLSVLYVQYPMLYDSIVLKTKS